MNTAVLQHADHSTSLVEEITESNFHLVAYRPATPSATIVEEGGVYVELDAADNSRKVLFQVKTASE